MFNEKRIEMDADCLEEKARARAESKRKQRSEMFVKARAMKDKALHRILKFLSGDTDPRE